MSISTIRQELDVIESTLTTMAELLERVSQGDPLAHGRHHTGAHHAARHVSTTQKARQPRRVKERP